MIDFSGPHKRLTFDGFTVELSWFGRQGFETFTISIPDLEDIRYVERRGFLGLEFVRLGSIATESVADFARPEVMRFTEKTQAYVEDVRRYVLARRDWWRTVRDQQLQGVLGLGAGSLAVDDSDPDLSSIGGRLLSDIRLEPSTTARLSTSGIVRHELDIDLTLAGTSRRRESPFEGRLGRLIMPGIDSLDATATGRITGFSASQTSTSGTLSRELAGEAFVAVLEQPEQGSLVVDRLIVPSENDCDVVVAFAANAIAAALSLGGDVTTVISARLTAAVGMQISHAADLLGVLARRTERGGFPISAVGIERAPHILLATALMIDKSEWLQLFPVGVLRCLRSVLGAMAEAERELLVATG